MLAKTGARTLGTFVMLPVVILALVAGTRLYVPAAPVVPALNSYWKWIHVTTIAHLLQHPAGQRRGIGALPGPGPAERKQRAPCTRPPATGEPGRRSTAAAPAQRRVRDRCSAVLPSMATLDRIAYRTAIVGFPLFTFAVIAGAMWAEVAWGRYWGWDPKETCAFVTWVFYAAYLHARSTAGWRGRRAAWICVVGFASMLFNLFFINMVVSGLHSYAGLN